MDSSTRKAPNTPEGPREYQEGILERAEDPVTVQGASARGALVLLTEPWYRGEHWD